jgi:prepilin-type N-terminal cleavage/methylation domain-containing protein
LKIVKISDKWQVTSGGELRASHSRRPPAFTLVEMLVVISILGILAALSVPAIKNIGKSDANASASRQLLDGVGRARQLAVANRTTVFMVFVPTNFWNTASGTFNTAWLNSLTPAQQTAATNLCDKQLTGYNFISNGTLGDQPGQHTWHYFDRWERNNLPEGAFIALWKFAMSSSQSNPVTDPITGQRFVVQGFATNAFPFPSVVNSPVNSSALVILPYVAFNYLGQLTFDGTTLAARDEYIPLAEGSVAPVIDVTTRALRFGTPSVLETLPGNSTNISYNIVHIDALTGRAVLENHKLQ